MNRLARHLDSVLCQLVRVRTTGMAFSWLDAPSTPSQPVDPATPPGAVNPGCEGTTRTSPKRL